MNYNAAGGRHPHKLGAKRLKHNIEGIPPINNYTPPFNPYSVPPGMAPSGMAPSGPVPGPGPIINEAVPQNLQYGVPQQPLPMQDPGYAIPSQYLTDSFINTAAMTYGQHLVGSGKKYVDQEIEKYVPVSRLKYYFAVDTAYVYKKLALIFFPFSHKDWSVKYASNEPVQPRYELNAPDLYIPTMAYLTYVLVAGLALGTQNRFTPEVLGIQASSALAWTILEILVHLVTLYVTAITTSLTTIDILAFSGYKFVGIIFAVLSSLMFYRLGYYVTLIYFSISLSFFLIRTLKIKILQISASPGDTHQTHQAHSHTGDKRRLYILLFIAGVQPVLMWWLSYHLVPISPL